MCSILQQRVMPAKAAAAAPALPLWQSLEYYTAVQIHGAIADLRVHGEQSSTITHHSHHSHLSVEHFASVVFDVGHITNIHTHHETPIHAAFSTQNL